MSKTPNMRPIYTTREANQNDIPQLSILLTELGYPTTEAQVKIRLASINNNPDYRTLVITDGEKTIGMAGLVHGLWYEKDGTYVHILAFVIREAYRGKGIGKLLIQAVEEWAITVGANAIILTSGNRDERVGAHLFYQSLGYEIKSSGFIKQL